MAKMYDDPQDELLNPGHSEPDGDEMDLDALMLGDISGGEDEELFPEDPLEQALTAAGFTVEPEKLSRIKAILTEKKPAPGAAPGAAKPGVKPMGGKSPAVAPLGGGVPAGMPASMGR